MSPVARIRESLRRRRGSLRPFAASDHRKRVLFLTEQDDIAVAQVAPFFAYARALARRQRLEIRALPLREFLGDSRRFASSVEAVCVQTWFDLSDGRMRDLMLRIRSRWPQARIAYLDWFAPTDLRYADVLHPHVAAYVKKQVLRDFSSYGRPTIGDTVLTDFYALRFGLEMPERCFTVPAGFERKLVLGPGFECSPLIQECLRRPLKLEGREIDLQARFATHGTEWYTRMRRECLDRAGELEARFRVAWRGQISRREFHRELGSSKMCFSPFGYGPVCWRDFEAMSSGALLLKQDMSYVRLAREFFVPYETYIPLAWDLSDLREKVEYYERNWSAREAIVRNAHAVLRAYTRESRFLQDVAPLWQLLGLDFAPAAAARRGRRRAGLARDDVAARERA
jgi:glycosyl transferase family 1